MPRAIGKPALPNGPGSEFTDRLFEYYGKAGRPKIRAIEEWCLKHSDDADVKGTMSKETFRRMLGGHVPHQWWNVEAAFLALCDIAGLDPDGPAFTGRYDSYDDERPPTRREHLLQLWNAALDSSEDAAPDPSGPPAGGFSDEPPF